MPWKRARIARSFKPLIPALVLALSVMGLAWAIQTERTLLGPIGMFLGTWLVAGAAVDLWSRTGKGGFARLKRLPRADWGKAVSHAGVGIVFLGVSGLMAWEQEDIRVVQIGERFEVAGFTLSLDRVEEVEGANYLSTMGWVTIRKGDRVISVVNPEKRVYPVARMPTTEAGIDNGFLRDVYVVIGDEQAGGGYAVRSYYKPLANWIWGGSILMAFGGLLSLSDRRHRVAAGARKTKVVGVPAE
jgi:cytochrome c-type biogenesis protein CcmF